MRLPRRSPRPAALLRFMMPVALVLAHAGVASADVVQVPVDSLLNGRPVTTLTGGQIVTWTAGVDDTDGLMTEAAEAYLSQTGTALPDDGTFPTDSRHPEIVLHFSNDASATSSQAFPVPEAGSFAVPVPAATYSSVYLVFTSSYGASALTVTMNYMDGSSVMTNVTVPDWAMGAPADDPVLFDLISGMHKWTNQNQEVDTPSHTLTGVELTAEPGKVLTAIQVEKPNAGQLLIFWGATGVATGMVGADGGADASADASADADATSEGSLDSSGDQASESVTDATDATTDATGAERSSVGSTGGSAAGEGGCSLGRSRCAQVPSSRCLAWVLLVLGGAVLRRRARKPTWRCRQAGAGVLVMRPVKWACVLGSHLVVVTGVAVARAQPQHAVVLCGDGPDSEKVVSRVVSHLRSPYQRREGDEFCKNVSSSPLGTLAAAATDRKADAKLMVRVRAAARSASADLAILVSMRRPRRGAPALHVWLVDASGDGAAEIDEEVTVGAGASTAEQGDAAWSVLAADLGAGGETEPSPASPPGAAEESTASPNPSGPSDADRGASSEPASEPRKDSLFSIRAAIVSGSRDFSYVDRVTATLRSYTLFAAPMGLVDAELYPFARTALPVLRDLGITGDYARAFAMSSDDSTGTSVSSTWSLFDIGAHERFAVGRSWLLGLGAGYGEMTFSLDGALATPAALPGVQYRSVRFGGDARVALGPFSLYGYGSYLDVLSTGPVGGYFAHATVGGLEGRLGLSRDLGHGFAVSLEVAYTRFFYTLNPQPGDAYVAGGALDQMAFASLGGAYIF